MEALDYGFMRSALLAGVVLGALFAFMGIFVVTRGMSFFSDFIAHSAILGGALALMAESDPALFLVPYSLVMAFAAASVWNSFGLSRDTVLGVFYGGAVASGIILISVKGLGQSTLVQFLFGDILLVGGRDIVLAAMLLAALAAFLWFNMRRLLKASFMPEIAAAEGVSVRTYDHALIGFIAITIALSIKLIGVILANAMVVIPAASAKLLARNFRQFVIIAPIMGVTAFVSGVMGSYYLNIPSGPSVIGAAFILFILSLITSKLRG